MSVDELDEAGSMLDESRMDIDELLSLPDLLSDSMESLETPADGDGGEGGDSFRRELFASLEALDQRSVLARVIELLHPAHKACTTFGDSPYAEAVSLGLLDALWTAVGSIYDQEGLVIGSFDAVALERLKQNRVVKRSAFALAVLDACGIAGTLKSPNLFEVGDMLRVQRNRLRKRADQYLRTLPANERDAEAKRLANELIYEIDLAQRVNSTSGRYSMPSVLARSQAKPLGEYNEQVEQKAQLKSVSAALKSAEAKLAVHKAAARRDSKRALEAERAQAEAMRMAAEAAAAAEKAAAAAEAVRAAEQKRLEAAAAEHKRIQAKLAETKKRLKEERDVRRAKVVALACEKREADAAARAAEAVAAQCSKDAAKAAQKQERAELLASQLLSIKLDLEQSNDQLREKARQAQTALRIEGKKREKTEKDQLEELRVQLSSVTSLLAEELESHKQLEAKSAKLEAENAKLAKLTRAEAGVEIAKLGALVRKQERKLADARGAALRLAREVAELKAELRRSRAATDAAIAVATPPKGQLSEGPVNTAALLDEHCQDRVHQALRGGQEARNVGRRHFFYV